ncbi:LacI family DNA-binding transcriptional regulator [Rhodophyticola sp. CCM32]|uniref:LacI family DNA-binding transcriptional regulator n=1 Tax=Rhodophyticola sp. CCM32 TaxID=2916397 RepID=UPI00143D2204|nr:LacI family DNA-binding transcriptional regulator [Rhodophyticola sp. CCM32]
MPKPQPSDGGPVTLRTIADHLGVSVTTVTRALKGGERIGADTVEKVKKTAEELGYVRNLDGVKLRTGQTFVALTFLSFSSEEEIGDSGSVGLLNGIHQRFAGTEYSVRAVPVTTDEIGLDRVQQVVKGRNADGIILDHTRPRDERVQFLLEQNVPFVTFGRTDLPQPHAYFDLDNEYAAYQGTKSLIDQGYGRVAMLDADLRYSFVGQRLKGYRRALFEAGIAYDPALVRHIDLSAPVARNTAIDLIGAKADAFVCVNELVFLGARAGVRQALGPAGDSLGFSLRTGTNIGNYIGTPLNTSYYSRSDAGWNLADLLLKRLDGADVSDCQRICKTELRVSEGQTLLG